MSTAAATPVRARRVRETAPPSAPVEPVAAPVAPAPVADVTEVPASAPLQRKPFGARRQKLAYPDRPGFHRHWFHDTPGRIQSAIEAGYAHVKEDGRNVQRSVGVRGGGGGITAYLMEINLEWYKEDQKAKLKSRDEIDAEIRRGVARGPNGETDNRYGAYGTGSTPGFTDSKITAESDPATGKQSFGPKVLG